MLKRPAEKHALVDSIDKMLAPESVTHLLNRPVTQVDCLPFESSNGFSANELFHVTADDQSLVLKRMRPAKDWLAIGTSRSNLGHCWCAPPVTDCEEHTSRRYTVVS